MWLLFRLCLAIAAALIRLRGRPALGRPELRDGRPYFVAVRRHKGNVRGFSVGVELRSAVVFQLSRETRLDRWFKRIGVATELQSGDPSFDDAVYVLSDHPALAAFLRDHAEARAAAREALDAGFDRLWLDGNVLWIRRSSSAPPRTQDFERAARIGDAFAALQHAGSRWTDPFARRALTIEALVWSMAAYAIAVVVGQRVEIPPHLHPGELFQPGMATALGLVVALIGAAIALFRGSSRGHRLIVESALVVLVSAWPAGIQLFADLNRGLDRSRSTVSAPLLGCERVQHSSTRRGRRQTWYTYHLGLADRGGAGRRALPGSVRTSEAVCAAAAPGRQALFVLGEGAFGHAWVRRVEIDDASWTP